MRHLQTYRIFEATQTLTDEQKEFLNGHTIGTWSLNPSTGKVDIDGDFKCYSEYLEDFKGISFGSVSGNFYCRDSHLKTLGGAPETVGGDFSCYGNSLRTLEGAPETVGGSFDCYENNIRTLEGAPRTVGGNFYCNYNSLQTLVGAPRTVGGSFDCSHNSLQTLVGAPETVGRDFHCNNNSLQTLEGAPETVGGSFDCSYNPLRTLEGAPETVGRKFYSGEIEIPDGEWSLETLILIYTTGARKQKQLVKPLVDPKVLQQQIDENPEGMIVKLKGHLKNPHFKDLRWPKHLDQEKDLLSNLSDVGL